MDFLKLLRISLLPRMARFFLGILFLVVFVGAVFSLFRGAQVLLGEDVSSKATILSAVFAFLGASFPIFLGAYFLMFSRGAVDSLRRSTYSVLTVLIPSALRHIEDYHVDDLSVIAKHANDRTDNIGLLTANNPARFDTLYSLFVPSYIIGDSGIFLDC